MLVETNDIAMVGNMLARYLYIGRMPFVSKCSETKYVSQQEIIVTIRAVFDRENNEDKKKQIENIASEKARKIMKITIALDFEKKENDPNTVIRSTINNEIII